MGAISQNERFLEAYENYAGSIFRLCYAKTSNREMALDLMQETFTKTWDYIASGKEVQNMQAFIFTIARNLIKDYYKKKRPVYEHEMVADPPDVADASQNPEVHAEAMQLMARVGSLKSDYQEVLLLRYVEGMAVNDIAKMLNERENTISVRINRALKELRSLFDGEHLKHHG